MNWHVHTPCRPDSEQISQNHRAEMEAAEATFCDYVFLRDNPAGIHRELWFHEMGDRSWLVVTRDTVTHEILGAELARDVALARGGVA